MLLNTQYTENKITAARTTYPSSNHDFAVNYTKASFLQTPCTPEVSNNINRHFRFSITSWEYHSYNRLLYSEMSCKEALIP